MTALRPAPAASEPPPTRLPSAEVVPYSNHQLVAAPAGSTLPASVAAVVEVAAGTSIDGTGAFGPGAGSRSSARLTFSRPPVATRPTRPGTGSTPPSSAAFTWAGVASGFFAKRSAAAPATCGVAIDVPSAAESPPFHHERMPVPGAARSTFVAP